MTPKYYLTETIVNLAKILQFLPYEKAGADGQNEIILSLASSIDYLSKACEELGFTQEYLKSALEDYENSF